MPDIPVTQDPIERGRALLKDGRVAEIRPLAPDDRDELERLMAQTSEESRFYRFLGALSPKAATAALLQASETRGAETLVMVAGRAVSQAERARGAPLQDQDVHIRAVGSFVPSLSAGRSPEAEVAFLVEDEFQQTGFGTILLERLALLAYRKGILRFVALVSGSNERMLQVFRDSGFPMTTAPDPDTGALWVTLNIEPTPESVQAFDQRDRIATQASLVPFFHPRAIAVVGASRRRGSIGRSILDNLVKSDFEGPVYPVNPRATHVGTSLAYPSVDALPDGVDLAIIAVPVAAVPDVVNACGRKNIRALVVITAGYAETGPEGRARQAELLRLARAWGVRLVGPNCLGLTNTDPDVRMNASFAPIYPPHGHIAMASQSGALGLALLEYARDQGLGLSSFISVGNKADVSGNDLLWYWSEDPATSVIVLYLESLGNPRRFARIARQVGRKKPILVVKAARTASGTRAAASHTAAMASSETAVTALFRQTGVLRADTLEDLFDTASLLVHQPLPKGPRTAVITNAGGPGIMTVDALDALGLTVPPPSDALREQVAPHLPPEASVRNPFDMIASAGPDAYRNTLSAVLHDDGYDSAVVIFIPIELTNPLEVLDAIRDATREARADGIDKPVLGVVMSGDAALAGDRHVLDPEGAAIPLYRFPESAARALSIAYRRARWLARPAGTLPAFPEMRLDRIREIVAQAIARGETWLAPDACFDILDAAGVSALPVRRANSPEEAATLARDLAGPLAVKIVSRTIQHKSDVGGVRLNVATGDVADVCRDIEARLASLGLRDDLEGFLLQPMAPSASAENALEMLAGVTVDPQFGPLVACGLGGTQVEALNDIAFRVLPLTDLDTEEMLDDLRSRRLLDGFRGKPALDRAALQDLLLRVAHVADAVPEIREWDINPVLVRPAGEGVLALDCRIRVGAET